MKMYEIVKVPFDFIYPNEFEIYEEALRFAKHYNRKTDDLWLFETMYIVDRTVSDELEKLERFIGHLLIKAVIRRYKLCNVNGYRYVIIYQLYATRNWRVMLTDKPIADNHYEIKIIGTAID